MCSSILYGNFDETYYSCYILEPTSLFCNSFFWRDFFFFLLISGQNIEKNAVLVRRYKKELLSMYPTRAFTAPASRKKIRFLPDRPNFLLIPSLPFVHHNDKSLGQRTCLRSKGRKSHTNQWHRASFCRQVTPPEWFPAPTGQTLDYPI